jgi:hypothetical protein
MFKLTADNGAVIAHGPDLRAIKFAIECWFPLGCVTYSQSIADEGEGWVYAFDGGHDRRLGYLEEAR